MKTLMVLLLSAVALLGSPAVANTTDYKQSKVKILERIIDLTKEVNTSLSRDLFVADVKDLVGDCGNKFFCKVHNVLGNQENVTEGPANIVRQLTQFNLHQDVNCKALLKGMNSTRTKIQMPEFMKSLTDCCKERIFNMDKNVNA
ncbi:hypothetical protein F2P81_008994 [Scophthalmus maximus]|uniref:Uncharacterized protein n=1 Tax=Scophthalmus maximus TaxID=52904 RepID=A0A6A4T3A2_SCOMX|nr:hypothetical protein F2P81_008994 [Scophthalmus maximus]